ncbi:hypothetical protein ACFQE5_02185 [Pseudonocardia hispaniensis]|uniref:Uncharacterized protein n=1 Tax=Pseudonocardia hispaniensis TaxID=904933 RepID=A0ABW1IX77_9PSEU
MCASTGDLGTVLTRQSARMRAAQIAMVKAGPAEVRLSRSVDGVE